MFCSACGSEISLAAAACPSCGRVVAPELVAARTATPQSPATSDSWAVPQGVFGASESSPSASIFAGDLDVPGFPRDMPRRVALLTGLVMTADLLLPWVTVNGDGVAPVRVGAPLLLLVAALVLVIAPPMIPRLRRLPVARVLPFGVGSLLIGMSLTLWVSATLLSSRLIEAFVAHVAAVGDPNLGGALGGQPAPQYNVVPSLGLYLFLLGACALVVAGYFALPGHGER